MVKFTSKLLLVTLVVASFTVEAKRKRGKNKKLKKAKKVVEAADLIRQIRGKDVSESDPFRWDDKYETTLLEGHKFEDGNVDESQNQEDNGGWKDDEDLKNQVPSSVGYYNGQAYIKNPNYPAYLTKPGLRKKLRKGKKKNRKQNKANKGNMANLLGENKRSAQKAPLNRKPSSKQASKRMPHHLVYSQKCWNGVFEPEDGMIIDARNSLEILSSPATSSNVISIPAGKRWNDFANFDILIKKYQDAIDADALYIPPKPLDDMAYIQSVWETNSKNFPDSKYKFMLACSNLYQCQTYYSILENKDLPVCIYDGDYNVVLKNDNINAFFMGLSDSEPGNWARSFSEDGDTDEANFEADFDAEAFEEGSTFVDPFYALDLAMPEYDEASGDYDADDYYYEETDNDSEEIYEEIAKTHEVGKTCSREYRLSYKKGVKKCDGWAETSKEECEQKCSNNELPEGCIATNETCKYAVWNAASSWCHTAFDCDFVESFDGFSKEDFVDNEIIEV